MKNQFLLRFVLLISSTLVMSQGYKFVDSNEEINNIDFYSKASLGFADDLPSKHDLIKYIPNIGDQKDSGSCVAWAVSYYSMSIIYNKSYGITSSEGKWAHRFDPWYLYNQLSVLNADTCSDGIGWNDVFSLSNRVGNKKFTIPPYDLHCAKEWTTSALKQTVSLSSKYSIKDYEQFDPEDYSSINKIKIELFKYSFPVVIGISHYGNGLDEIGNDGIFRPNYDEANWDGHAMTIVGYDDYKNGGSFLVVNSWGATWGNNGYMWMNYNDFARYTDRAFAFYVDFESLDEQEFDNFTRDTWDDDNQIYEGQIYRKPSGGWNAQGYGINYNKELQQYSVGKWNNGKQGKFYVVENGKWYTEYYKDGVKQTYGFATEEEDDQLEMYLNSLFSDSEISSINE